MSELEKKQFLQPYRPQTIHVLEPISIAWLVFNLRLVYFFYQQAILFTHKLRISSQKL